MLVLLCLVYFLVILDAAIVRLALPSIHRALGLSTASQTWVANAYMLSFGTLLLLWGRVADLVGRKRVLLAGLGLFALASLACGLATSGAELIVARTVQGVGAAAMTPAALSILMRTFPEGASRNKAIGAWGATRGIGATAAWIIGGPLIDGPGWEWLASGLNNTFEQVGGALGTAIMATIAVSRTTDLLHAGATRPFALDRGFQLSFAAAITFPILGFIVSMVLLRRFRPAVGSESLQPATAAAGAE